MPTHKLAIVAILTISTPALADCPLINTSKHPLSIFTGERERKETVVAAGASINVPDGEFSAVMGQGAHGGKCRAGVKFEVIQDPKITWAVTPRVIERPR